MKENALVKWNIMDDNDLITILENGIGVPSRNLGWDCLHFALCQCFLERDESIYSAPQIWVNNRADEVI